MKRSHDPGHRIAAPLEIHLNIQIPLHGLVDLEVLKHSAHVQPVDLDESGQGGDLSLGLQVDPTVQDPSPHHGLQGLHDQMPILQRYVHGEVVHRQPRQENLVCPVLDRRIHLSQSLQRKGIVRKKPLSFGRRLRGSLGRFGFGLRSLAFFASEGTKVHLLGGKCSRDVWPRSGQVRLQGTGEIALSQSDFEVRHLVGFRGRVRDPAGKIKRSLQGKRFSRQFLEGRKVLGLKSQIEIDPALGPEVPDGAIRRKARVDHMGGQLDRPGLAPLDQRLHGTERPVEIEGFAMVRTFHSQVERAVRLGGTCAERIEQDGGALSGLTVFVAQLPLLDPDFLHHQGR